MLQDGHVVDRALGSASPLALASPELHDHQVHFYGDSDALVDGVTRFVGAALGAGDAALVVATAEHRERLKARLRARGLDVVAAARQGRYLALDAAEVLSRIMDGDRPDARRFVNVIGGVLARLSAENASANGIAVFGEMVALLSAAGNLEAAIALEQLWNELARARAFSLYCAYSIDHFGRTEDSEALELICAQHTRVIPTESYTSLVDEDERSRAITSLQQKARALATEIDERRKAQRSLRHREAELTDLIENALEGVQQVGPDQIIAWANRALLDLLGYTVDEYVGQPLVKFYVQPGTFEEYWSKLMRRENVYDFPVELRCMDGSVKRVLVHSNGRWEGDRFIHARCFIRDVTEHQRMEQELRDRNEELYQAIAARDEFLSVAAHELKTPVAGIKATAQLARRTHDHGRLTAERLERYVDSIVAASDRLAALTNDLLDVARIRSGRLALSVEAIDLGDWLRGVFAGYEERLGERYALNQHLPTEPCIIPADPQRLEQVLVNLLDNAVKYSPNGGGIEVAVEPGDDDVTVRVRDEGIGLPPDALETIFEPFGRAPNAARHHLPGMGLGLYICRDILERHGGRIWAESPGENQGTSIVLVLPRAAVAQQLITSDRIRPSREAPNPE